MRISHGDHGAVRACSGIMLTFLMGALTGCGAHNAKSVPVGTALSKGITPAASGPPEGVLTATAGGAGSAPLEFPKPAPAAAAPAAAAASASAQVGAPGARLGSTRLFSPMGEVTVQQVPEAITQVPYVYPQNALERGVQGTVELQVLVGGDGKVYDVKVTRSIPLLDEAAKAAIRQWKFTPAISDGRSVAVWFPVPVKFTLP